MLRILLFFLFVTASFAAKADYSSVPLSTVMCHVDYGAVGTIVKVDNNYFYLKVEKYVLNKLELDTIPIVRFYNWACAWRYEAYRVGQRELVFFSKSNDLTDRYDFIGFGMADESELPIFSDSIGYQYNRGKMQKFGLNDFLATLSDFAKLKGNVRITEDEVTKSKWETFAKRSPMHRMFVGRCYDDDAYYYIPSKEIKVELETNYLYEKYENRLFINNIKQDSIYISIKDADVRKEKNYYVVSVQKGLPKRKLSVYVVKAGRRQLLFEKSFEVKSLPDPVVSFVHLVGDTIYFYGSRSGAPEVAYFYNGVKEEHPKYKLLAYNYEITSGEKHEVFVAKSQYGSHDLWERLKRLENNDRVTLSNVFVLFPNNEVKQLPNKTAVVKMMKETSVEVIHVR